MSQWVLMVALLTSAVAIVVWLRSTAQSGGSPHAALRLPPWISRLLARLPRSGAGDGGLAQLTRRILDEVVTAGDRTMHDRAIILPDEIVVHAAPSDVELLNQYREVIERDVSAEISASGEREGWVSAGPLRIVEIRRDPAIAAGRPHVQRAASRPRPLRTQPLPPELPPSWPPSADPVAPYELRPVGGGDPLAVPDAGGLVGRDPRRCAVVVSGSTVSREHALLEPVDGGFRVRDVGSVNGVTVNGRRAEEAVVRDGDVLGLGRSVRLELRRTDAARI